MNTERQNVPGDSLVTERSMFEALLDKTYVPSATPSSTEQPKRQIEEIVMVTVEKTIVMQRNVCSICEKPYCKCTPRTVKNITKTIRYTVEQKRVRYE